MKALETQNATLKETQFDRAFALIDNQKKVYDADIKSLNGQISEFSKQINNKSLQIDEFRKILKCESQVIDQVIKGLIEGKIDPKNPGMPVEEFQKLTDTLCLYKPSPEDQDSGERRAKQPSP